MVKMGPRGRQSRQPAGNQLINNLPPYQVSFDRAAFNALVSGQGVRMVHFKALPDPNGIASRGDTHDVSGTRESSDGFLYREAGCLQVAFMNNGTSQTLQDIAIIDESMAYLTFPTHYEGSEEEVIVSDWDRFYLKDVEVRVETFQLVEASVTGIDRLQYPATCVVWLVDSDGVEYQKDKDFVLDSSGNIVWVGQKRPGIDPKLGRGKVYSVRYRYVPFFVVQRLLHEVRVSQVTDPVTFERTLERMPYQAFVVREKVLQDRNRAENPVKVQDPRYARAPSAGGAMGPK